MDYREIKSDENTQQNRDLKHHFKYFKTLDMSGLKQ